MLLLVLLICMLFQLLDGFVPSRGFFRTPGSILTMTLLRKPESIQAMMMEAGRSVLAYAKEEGDATKICGVEVPIPVTGGTELDDWPGGIKQKYSVLRSMIIEMMKEMNFTTAEMETKNFLGQFGEDDAVGIWQSEEMKISVISFPNPDCINTIKNMQRNENDVIVLVNQQFFSGQNFNEDTALFDFINSKTEIVYQYEVQNQRGPGTPPLPIRGLLYRKYPEDYIVTRKLDNGDQVILQQYKDKAPTRDQLEKLFFDDSEERDRDLSLIDRLKKQIPKI